jgi:hypothetical protein
VCRAFIVLAAALTAAAALSGSGSARLAALACGLPEAQPTWIDYADSQVSFWRERFGRSGIVVATGGPGLATEARVLGASTIHWDMYLKKRVGTPAAPADAAGVAASADAMYQKAVSVTGCDRPMIALNELWGGWQPTPLTSTGDQYRANVLAYVRRLSERGARPALLVSGRPFTGGDAAPWWNAVAAVSDLVLEKYPNANTIWRGGPVDGSRQLRTSYRSSIEQFTSLGIPPARLGIMVGFQTRPGAGGREGLEPRSRWFSVAKWQALAARQVARELRLSHVWSWGWATYDERGADPDKTYAACVWLWSRDPGLCDAPGTLGEELDTDVGTGQLTLPAGVRCTYGSTAIKESGIASLAALTGDRELALTALVARIVQRERSRVSPSAALATERRIVAARFRGNLSAYRSALRDAGVTPAGAREIVGDELQARDVGDRLVVQGPSAKDVARFRETYAAVPAREVEVTPAPSWLPTGSGVALGTTAPHAVFELGTGKRAVIATAEGRFTVRALEDTTALGGLPAELARPAVVHELRSARRAEAYAEWSIKTQKAAQARLVCERDRLPELGAVRLSLFAPFLSLHEAEASSWLLARRARAR